MKALLVIDLLNDFVHPQGALFVGERAKEVITFSQEIISEYRKENIPIIYVCDSHRPDDQEFTLFPPHSIEGSWGGKVTEALTPQAGDYIIPKRRFSAFFGTSLDLLLREKKIEQLEIVGVCTNICVLYTSAGARMLNYQVVVREKGVTSFDLAAHEWALREMKNTLGVEVK
ncbi:MAG TPA: isochorismatase family cysteine hydrolase [Candidatus Atribacteria bacterium]|nr:isochorismatase family cysteine hydrolase [Candidatus Atribacteria bacterium]